MKRKLISILAIVFQTEIYAECEIEPIRGVPHIAIDEAYSNVRQKLLSSG